MDSEKTYENCERCDRTFNSQSGKYKTCYNCSMALKTPCAECGKMMKNSDYKVCYMSSKKMYDKCPRCGKGKQKKYPKCWNCEQEVKNKSNKIPDFVHEELEVSSNDGTTTPPGHKSSPYKPQF